MTGIWRKDGDAWKLALPSSYSNEEELHDHVKSAPDMLPLSGQPTIVASYREVPLSGGFADVLAFEASGRPVVVEVKLARNTESRRRVVAQVLDYGAALHGKAVEDLEGEILGKHLAGKSLTDAIEEEEGEGAIDADEFVESLEEHLQRGSFRLVIVVDDAHAQTAKIAGYLDAIADRVIVDLVTVQTYDVNGTQVLLPQRIDPEHVPEAPRAWPSPKRYTSPSPTTEGSARFREQVAGISDSKLRERLSGLADRLDALETAGLCRVYTGEGKTTFGLHPRPLGERTHIASLYLPKNEPEKYYIWVWISVAKRLAPNALPELARTAAIEDKVEAGKRATGAQAVTDELLDALTAAYREAAGKD